MRTAICKAGVALGLASATAIALGAPAAPAIANTVHRVEIRSFRFVPATITAKPGDTIVFVNRDVVPHTATATDKRWDSGTLEQGKNWSLTVKSTGRITFTCLFHPLMKGTLIVK